MHMFGQVQMLVSSVSDKLLCLQPIWIFEETLLT